MTFGADAPPPPPPPPPPPSPYGAPGYSAYSDKSKVVAGLLQLLLPFVGVCGVGRLYAGQIGIGLLQLLGFWLGSVLIIVLVGLVIAPAIWLWAVVDGIIMLAGSPRDAQGRLLRP